MNIEDRMAAGVDHLYTPDLDLHRFDADKITPAA
jgi:hypothetical protein